MRVQTKRLLLVLLSVLVFSAGQCDPGEDKGRLTSEYGYPMTPMVLPWHVCIDARSMEVEPHVQTAIEQWQEWARQDDVPRDWFVFLGTEHTCEQSTPGEVFVTIGVPVEDTAFAQAELVTRDGEIIYCTITLAYDWLWVEDEWIVLWLLHEMGHCMGLAHDGRGTGSIMQSPSYLGTFLTHHAFLLLIGVISD